MFGGMLFGGHAPPPPFPSTTSMVFQQSSAPTGWTKQTSHNDKAMRLVTGSVSSGGSSAFSTVFGKTATDGYTLLEADLASHDHTTEKTNTNTGSSAIRVTASNGTDNGTLSGVNNTGSSAAHSHAMDIRVQYVDFIIANKD